MDFGKIFVEKETNFGILHVTDFGSNKQQVLEFCMQRILEWKRLEWAGIREKRKKRLYFWRV